MFDELGRLCSRKAGSGVSNQMFMTRTQSDGQKACCSRTSSEGTFQSRKLKKNGGLVRLLTMRRALTAHLVRSRPIRGLLIGPTCYPRFAIYTCYPALGMS